MSTVNYLLQKESGKYERRLKFHSYNDSSFNFQFGVFFCCAVEEKKFHPPAKKKKKKKEINKTRLSFSHGTGEGRVGSGPLSDKEDKRKKGSL